MKVTSYKVAGATTDQPPSLAFSGTTYILAWADNSSGTGPWPIKVSFSTDGMNWSSPPTPIEGKGWTAQTKESPSVMVDWSGNLWAAWRGDGDDQIWYSYCTPSTLTLNWSQQQTVKDADGKGTVKTASAPALAFNDGTNPAIAWRDKHNELWYATIVGVNSVDPRFGPTQLNQKSHNAPTVTTSTPNPATTDLTFAWRDHGNDQLLYLTVESGKEPPKKDGYSAVGATSDKRPALPSFAGELIPGLVWKGDKNSIMISTSFPSSPLNPEEVLGTEKDNQPMTDNTPAWAGGVLGVVAYKSPSTATPPNTLYTFIVP